MCSPPATRPKEPAGLIKVVCTTGMVADLARQILQGEAEVTVLMGPGMDPHSFTPGPAEMAKLKAADVIVANGLRLEGKLEETFATLQRQGRQIVLLGEKLPRDQVLDADGLYDPHIWGDLSLWSKLAEPFVAEMSVRFPTPALAWRSRGIAYQKQLLKVHSHMKQLVDRNLEKPQRVLVTSHDAFRYFGRAYGLEVKAAQGISTATEAGLKDVVELAKLVKDRGLKAVFVESSVSPAVIQRLSKDTGAKVGGELFSDALGAAEDKVTLDETTELGCDTVAGMQLRNMQTIIRALKN
jgi:manganese/zinc/iron transport system substrate-binding protein